MTTQTVESAYNRRRSFRIYDDVDIFYQRLEQSQTKEPKEYSDITLIPESSGSENPTLNVNISTSGLSFTCQENLQPGELIQVRILLLSTMTLVMCCCRVVYCKPSNPYEDNSYPYTLGAEFVKLRPEDKALLNRHIQKKHKWQWFKWGVFLTALLTLIYIPDVIMDLFLEQIELLFDIGTEIVYMLDEVINYWISYGMSFIFPQSPHTVQTIGFYLQLALYLILLGWLGTKWLPRVVESTLFRLRRYFSRKRASLRYYWQHLSWLKKAGLVTAFFSGISLYFLFFI
ncbi:PilZ domain-containing protein [methane-oxidizing endosymbiont of Gigantopelta aegis]|uniref:PilZ domain-containing protein n=1 Tax=methane-oxidizing endosymbiont of Gigantopelta aegis TaxID=2794938 RepID=UPI0018DCAFD1|nr:PilZ domain-containing protein [methane-oxidizing endosymbiont of Gigantopelta aegis]